MNLFFSKLDEKRKTKELRVVFWGTYDTGKPRVRILISGARAACLEVTECHIDIWKGIEDKSQLKGIFRKIELIISILIAYPVLIYRYLRLPHHDIVIVPYMGQFDVLILKMFAKLRRIPICWDVFLSLYDTIVIDRKLVGKKSLVARLSYTIEWLSSRAANLIFLDTKTHAKYFEKIYKLPQNSVGCVYVGAELEVFRELKFDTLKSKNFSVLFYGQFIPLHGIETIVYAAKRLEDAGKRIKFVIIGKGQEKERIDDLIKKLGIMCIHRIPWVPFEKLVYYIQNADICLGIFGDSGKATRVIPNKVYQILSAGKPLITGDTPAIRELLNENPKIRLVEPGNSEALATAVLDLRNTIDKKIDNSIVSINLPIIGPMEVGKQLIELFRGCNL